MRISVYDTYVQRPDGRRMHFDILVPADLGDQDTVLQYGRRWQPGRGASAALESVWSVTDPPLKALRRVIPPLRIGNVSLDLASLVLLVILFVLLNFVLARLIMTFSV